MKLPISKLRNNTGQVDGVPANPRSIDKADYAKLLKSIQEDPEYLEHEMPHVIKHDDVYVVLNGNQRLRALKELGYKEVPVTVYPEDTSPEVIKARIIKSNHGYGNDDMEMLGNEWSDEPLGDWGVDLPEDWLEQEPEIEEDEAPEVSDEPPVSKLGDVYQLGRHRVMCGDAHELLAVQRLADGKKINLAFTSPPYASQREYDTDSDFKPVKPNDYADWYREIADNIAQVLSDNGSYFCNIKEHCEDGQRHMYVTDLLLSHVREWGWMWVDTFCWRDKKNGVPGGWNNRFKDAWEPIYHYARQSNIKFNPLANGTDSNDVFDYSSGNATSGTGSGLLGQKASSTKNGIARPSNVIEVAASSASDHSAAYPLELPAWFIRAFTDKGDLVYDPFMGSGTTLIAAHELNRVALGMEISPKYVDVIRKRYHKFVTGSDEGWEDATPAI